MVGVEPPCVAYDYGFLFVEGDTEELDDCELGEAGEEDFLLSAAVGQEATAYFSVRKVDY